jgi:hypothetical protein
VAGAPTAGDTLALWTLPRPTPHQRHPQAAHAQPITT